MVKIEQKEGKRRKILQAAEELLAERTSHEVKLDEVAVRARIGKGTIYLYFKDKDDLFFEVAMSGFGELCELVRREAAKTRGDFRSQLLEVCQSISAFFEQRKALFREMQNGQYQCGDLPKRLRDRWMSRRRELVEAIGGVIRAGQDQGALRSDAPAEVLGDFLLGMMRTRARDLRDAEATYRSEEFLVRFFCEGAGFRATSTITKDAN